MRIKTKISKTLLLLNILVIASVTTAIIFRPGQTTPIIDYTLFALFWYYILIYPVTTIISWKLSDYRNKIVYKAMIMLWVISIILLIFLPGFL